MRPGRMAKEGKDFTMIILWWADGRALLQSESKV
jgi:hypothetical protein